MTAGLSRWLKAFGIAIAITFVALLLAAIGGNLSEGSIIRKVLGVLALILLFPTGLVMNAIFPGPPEDPIVMIVMFGLTFLLYAIVIWVVLTLKEVIRRRRARGDERAMSRN